MPFQTVVQPSLNHSQLFHNQVIAVTTAVIAAIITPNGFALRTKFNAFCTAVNAVTTFLAILRFLMNETIFDTANAVPIATPKAVITSTAYSFPAIKFKASPIALSTVTITPPVHFAIGFKKFSNNQSTVGLTFSITPLRIDIAFARILRNIGTISFITQAPSGVRTFSQNHSKPSPTFSANGSNAFHNSSRAELILPQSILDIICDIASINRGKPSPSTHLPIGFKKSL